MTGSRQFDVAPTTVHSRFVMNITDKRQFVQYALAQAAAQRCRVTQLSGYQRHGIHLPLVFHGSCFVGAVFLVVVVCPISLPSPLRLPPLSADDPSSLSPRLLLDRPHELARLVLSHDLYEVVRLTMKRSVMAHAQHLRAFESAVHCPCRRRLVLLVQRRINLQQVCGACQSVEC